ncbi:MAG: PAS domain-containing sensor histidine kinase, partial [Cytophagales bacterium]
MDKVAIFDALYKSSPNAIIVLEANLFQQIYANRNALSQNISLAILSELIDKNHQISSFEEIKNNETYRINNELNLESLQYIDNEKISYRLLQINIRLVVLEAHSYMVIETIVLFDTKESSENQSFSQRLLQKTIDLFPEPVFLKDNQRRLIMVNKTFLEFHQLDHSQVIGKKDEDIKSNKEEYQRFISDDLEVINNRTSKQINKESFTNFQGNKISLQTTKEPFYFNTNSEDNPGIIGIAIDITAKISFKEHLLSNKKMQRQIVDLVPHMIFIKDVQGRYVFVNKEFLKRTGWKESYIIGKTASDLYSPNKAERYTREDQDVLSTLQEKIIEKEFGGNYLGAPSIYNVLKRPYFDYETNQFGILAICTDLTEKMRNKELLDQQKNILNEIINLLPQEIYLKDEDSKFILANKACAELFHLSAEELVGKTDYDLFDKEFAEQFYQIEKDIALKGITKYIKEETSIDKFGVKRIKNVIKMPFYLSDKRKNGILGINFDITEEKNAEKKIIDSEIRYKSLMEQASDGIYLSDEEGNIIAANQKAAEIFGYELAEFQQQNIKKIVAPDFEQHQTVRMPFSEDKQSLILERKFQKKDGSSFTAELSVKLLEDGKHQAILRDVTERKKQEKILVDNEKKFRLLIENSSDIIIILSQNFIVKFVSPSVYKLLGYNEENLIGSSILGLLNENDIEQTSHYLSKVLSNKNHLNLDELKIKNNNNEFQYFETVAVNMLEDENINGIIINCHDITKRKITENELINTNFELDSFVYKASHDLKAPLRSVMGLIKLARLECTDV